jgi:competence protein ComEA
MKVILAIVILTIMYIFGMSKLEIMRLSDLIMLSSTSTVVSSAKPSSTASSSSVLPLKMNASISGAVKKPGNYVVSNNAFLKELIDAAGGLSENADPESFNLEYVISVDKQSIYIASKSVNPKISINSATIDELELLPSIGVVSATNIVNYRIANGGFLTLEDILKVDRIGEKTYLAIRDLIKL